MSNSPNPVSRAALSRALVIGAVLGIGAIILFVVLWVALGSTGLNDLARLFLSICIPPAIVAALIGGYLLIWRSRS